MNKTLPKRIRAAKTLFISILILCAPPFLLSGCSSVSLDNIIPGNKHIRDATPAASADTEDGAIPVPRFNSYPDLSVPTQITKIGETYFIVDCYHNQVIYNDNLEDPLTDWKIMTDEMIMGHTVAGDGTVYLIDDTENERIMIFEKKDDSFIFTKELKNVTGRPHYVVYDEKSENFYAWCSVSGELYVIKRDDDNNVYVSDIRKIPELDGVYVRSFTITGDEILFVSGNSSIIKAKLDTLEVIDRYPVPDELAGMIQITPIDNKYYITISTNASWDQSYATIIRCDSLEDLEYRNYEDIYSNFIGGGTPYYITSFDGAYYLTEHRLPDHSIWRFKVENGNITAETIY